MVNPAPPPGITVPSPSGTLPPGSGPTVNDVTDNPVVQAVVATAIAPEGPGEAFDAEKLEQLVQDIIDWLSHGGTKAIKQIPHWGSDFGASTVDNTRQIRFDSEASHRLK